MPQALDKTGGSLLISRPSLKGSDVEVFQSRGYTILRQAYARDMARIDSWCEEMLKAPEVSGRHWVYWEKNLKNAGEKIVARIERLAPFHAGFAELADSLGNLASQALGETSQLFKEKINFKMAGGDGFKPHQDSQAGWETYAPYFITVLLAVDEATIENGCVEFADRPSDMRIFREWEPLTDNDIADMTFAPITTQPGDVVIFDSYTPHRSAPNMTSKMRRVYYATYNRAADGDHHDAYYRDKHKNYPPDIDRDPTRNYVFRV